MFRKQWDLWNKVSTTPKRCCYCVIYTSANPVLQTCCVVFSSTLVSYLETDTHLNWSNGLKSCLAESRVRSPASVFRVTDKTLMKYFLIDCSSHVFPTFDERKGNKEKWETLCGHFLFIIFICSWKTFLMWSWFLFLSSDHFIDADFVSFFKQAMGLQMIIQHCTGSVKWQACVSNEEQPVLPPVHCSLK